MAQWCPRCRAEYIEGWGNCSNCDVPLVDQLPPAREQPAPGGRTRVSFLNPGGQRMVDPDEFVPIWEGPTPEGYGLGARLEARHIPFGYGEAAEPGRLRLEVPRSYMSDAIEALDDPLPDVPVGDVYADASEDADGDPENPDLRRESDVRIASARPLPGVAGWPPAAKAAFVLLAVALVVLLVLSSR